MLVPRVCAPGVTRCSLGKYWSRDLHVKRLADWLAGWRWVQQARYTGYLWLGASREIHPLEPQRHRHSMLAPRVCAPRVTRWSLGHVIWSVQLACSILSRSDSCQGDGRQRHLMMHGQCPIPVYSSQVRGSEIWWCMQSAHSPSTTPSLQVDPVCVTCRLRANNLVKHVHNSLV